MSKIYVNVIPGTAHTEIGWSEEKLQKVSESVSEFKGILEKTKRVRGFLVRLSAYINKMLSEYDEVHISMDGINSNERGGSELEELVIIELTEKGRQGSTRVLASGFENGNENILQEFFDPR